MLLIGILEFVCLIACPVGLIWLLFNVFRSRSKKKQVLTMILSFCVLIALVFLSNILYYDEIGKYQIDSESREDKERFEQDTEEIIAQSEEVPTNSSTIKTLETTEALIDESIQPSSEKDIKYTLNNFLDSYNSIAEYIIDDETMKQINESNRPLWRFTYYFSNGVYVIISYNDFNNMLFIDYHEENSTDENVYPVFRDFCKSVVSTYSDDEILDCWKKLQSLEYQYYDEYDFNGLKCTYSIQNMINGQSRYYIKTSYQY